MNVKMSNDVKHNDNVNDNDNVDDDGDENEDVSLLTRFYSPVFYKGDKSKRPPPPPAAAVANTRKLNIEYYNLYNCKPFFLGTNGVINH